MNRKTRFTRWLVGMIVLAVAECAFVATVQIAFTDQAYAQSRRRGGFFQQLFGGPRYEAQPEQEREAPVDYSRAPSPRKSDAKAEPVGATTSILVVGDGMADWLAYGLEDAFSDSPEVAIVREAKTRSGLLHYDGRSDLDWWDAARDILAKQNANYVVMMIGVSDRQNIREKDLEKEAEEKDAKPGEAAKKDDKKDDGTTITVPEPKQIKRPNGVVEFRSDQWEKAYSRRIDLTAAALKSKGVPVFWVGLPSIRGTRSTADAVYLNDLYRARAERAGAVYIDVWDGFVDEGGKYTTYGPDYEGQTRRLRSGDGVYFTKYGARKLAHYVEREIRRYMSNRGTMALPSGPLGPLPADGKPAARPLAGPVVPLTMTSGDSDTLLGSGQAPQGTRADAIATGVLVKGDPVAAPAGRADDFVWPRGSDSARVVPAAAAASASAPAVSQAKPAAAAIAKPELAKPEPAKPAAAPAAPVAPPAAKPAAKPADIKPQRQTEQRPQREAPPRPPQPVQQRASDRSGGLFGLFR